MLERIVYVAYWSLWTEEGVKVLVSLISSHYNCGRWCNRRNTAEYLMLEIVSAVVDTLNLIRQRISLFERLLDFLA